MLDGSQIMCRILHMATNLAIDDRLLEEALKIGGHRTKKATVTEALNEYIQKRQQSKLLDLFGKIEIDPAYDYKKQRRRK
jgi:Arc/MetJ family transcription regulator